MANGEIAHNEQFLLLPHCFPKLSAAEVSEIICMMERVDPSPQSDVSAADNVAANYAQLLL